MSDGWWDVTAWSIVYMHLVLEVPHLADEHLVMIDDHLRLWTAGWWMCVCRRRTVVCPIIDVISDDTFEYMAGSDMTYGGFNWKLNFRWYPVPQREMDRRKGDRTLPVRLVLQHVWLAFLKNSCLISTNYRAAVVQLTLTSLFSQVKREFAYRNIIES